MDHVIYYAKNILKNFKEYFGNLTRTHNPLSLSRTKKGEHGTHTAIWKQSSISIFNLDFEFEFEFNMSILI